MDSDLNQKLHPIHVATPPKPPNLQTPQTSLCYDQQPSNITIITIITIVIIIIVIIPP